MHKIEVIFSALQLYVLNKQTQEVIGQLDDICQEQWHMGFVVFISYISLSNNLNPYSHPPTKKPDS